jgi:putative transposase
VPRPPRLHVPGGCYHVTLRGNHRQTIFRADADREDLSELLGEALQRFEARAHAYCWMTNHIHLLTQVADVPLGRIIHNVASRYAHRFQRSVPTTGHLFECRYHASLLHSDEHLLGAVRYIHRNPVEAGILADPQAYQWSSHRAYLDGSGPSWLTTRFVLGVLNADEEAALRAYHAFMTSVSGTDWSGSASTPAASGGLTRRHEPPAASGHALNGDVRRPRAAMAGNEDRPQDLEALIARACDRAGLPADLLASASRIPRLSALRASIAAEALSEHVATLSAVARRFERNVASVSRLLQHHEALQSNNAQRRAGANAREHVDEERGHKGQLPLKMTKAKPGT